MSKAPDHNRTPSVQLKIEATGGPIGHRKWNTIIIRNCKYFGSQLAMMISRSSPIVQMISITLIAFYLLSFTFESLTLTLILNPASVLSPGQWLWSSLAALIHPYIEFHWYNILIDIFIVSLCGTLIEPLWGHKELITFILSINLLVGFSTVITYILLYSITKDAFYLFSVYINGFIGLNGAVCIAIKQLIPDSTILTTSFGKIKNDHIPLTVLVVLIILKIINLINGSSVFMFAYGELYSWIYLRFIQPHNGRHGDPSDQFAFHTFFPNVIQPIVLIWSSFIYSIFVKIGCCSSHQSTHYNQYQTYRTLSERLINDHNTNHSSNSSHNTLPKEFDQPKVQVL